MGPPSPPSPASAPNFDGLARLYRWMEYLSFGPFLWRCRIHFLHRLADCRSALVLGDGDGRFTARLLRANPAICVHAVDLSPRMIESLERVAAPCRNRLVAEVADLRSWNPEASGQRYDLVVTHFFLDCLSTGEVMDLARRVAPALARDAVWLVSEFGIPPTRFGRALAAPVVASLYYAFRLLTGLRVRSLPEYGQVLTAAGWSLKAECTHLRGLLVSQLWQFHPE
jgi:SAM-dependent methyltransferase